MKECFLLLSLFFMCICLGQAQNTVIKHTVEKGETVFQLSKRYNVSVDQIYELNPSAVAVIKIGETLSIPNTSTSTSNSTSNSFSSSALNSLTYAVVYGDTKFSLAKRFGISLAELEQQNPHIKNGLQAGHILKIESQKQNTSKNDQITIKKTHRVLKGQTLWGISKENGLTVEQLVNANSEILSGILQIDQLLKIPEPYSVLNGSYETYVVQRGDTKYGLSKKYDMSIMELEKANPQISRMLMAGVTIQIPKATDTVETFVVGKSSDTAKTDDEKTTENETEAITTDPTSAQVTETPINETTNQTEVVTEEKTPVVTDNTNNGAYENYEIKAQETLYGLAKKAGMSISNFVTLNPQLSNGVQLGMVVKMPKENSTTTIETSNTQNISEENIQQRYVDLSKSIETSKKNEILLFLPFTDAQFTEEYGQNRSFDEVPDAFLKEHLEFYRGVKIAQDSAKTLGLDFNIQIIQTKTNERANKLANLAKESGVDSFDAIIIPFYEIDGDDLTALINGKNSPVLSTGTLKNGNGQNNVYNAIPSASVTRRVMLDYLISKEANLIVVSDTDRNESKSDISEKIPNAKFIDVSKKGSFDDADFVAQLDKTKLNYVIFDSEKNSLFLSTTNLLFGELSNYNIQLALLEYGLLPNTDDVSKKRFVILQMLYPSLTPLDETSMTSNFNTSYKKKYSVEPTQNTKYGYDLTFDTLLRLSQSKSFNASAESDISEYSALKFDYKPNKLGGHDNTGIYIIQYNSDGTLKELK